METYRYSVTFDPNRRLTSGSWMDCSCGWRGQLKNVPEVILRQNVTDDGKTHIGHVIYPCRKCGLVLAEEGSSTTRILPADGPLSSAERITQIRVELDKITKSQRRIERLLDTPGLFYEPSSQEPTP